MSFENPFRDNVDLEGSANRNAALLKQFYDLAGQPPLIAGLSQGTPGLRWAPFQITNTYATDYSPDAKLLNIDGTDSGETLDVYDPAGVISNATIGTNGWGYYWIDPEKTSSADSEVLIAVASDYAPGGGGGGDVDHPHAIARCSAFTSNSVSAPILSVYGYFGCDDHNPDPSNAANVNGLSASDTADVFIEEGDFPAWLPETTYAVGEVVTYNNGSGLRRWSNNVAGVSGTTFIASLWTDRGVATNWMIVYVVPTSSSSNSTRLIGVVDEYGISGATQTLWDDLTQDEKDAIPPPPLVSSGAYEGFQIQKPGEGYIYEYEEVDFPNIDDVDPPSAMAGRPLLVPTFDANGAKVKKLVVTMTTVGISPGRWVMCDGGWVVVEDCFG